MRTRLVLGVVFAITQSLVCGLVAQAASPGIANGEAQFERFLSCDGGAVELFAERSERRIIRLRINDLNIVDYFSSQKAWSLEFAGLIKEKEGRVSIIGGVAEGIFDGGAFHRFEDVLGGEYDDVIIAVHREGSGLKLTSHYVRPSRVFCESWLMVDPALRLDHICTRWSSARPPIGQDYHERANWYFRDCHETR